MTNSAASKAISRHRGFTLVEILVVMAIVALLLSIAWPRYMAPVEASKETVLRKNLQVMRLSIDNFVADKGRFPESLQELVETNYLLSVPVDPITESSSTWVLVPSRNLDQKGISDVKSGAPGAGRSGLSYGSL